jgi:hypothetical protein
MNEVVDDKPSGIPYSVGQRVSLRIETGDLPEGQIGEVVSIEPPDQVWVLFKNVYDDPGMEDARVEVYVTDIEPAASPKK